MAFTPKVWHNNDPATPWSAAAAIDMETRLSGYTDTHSALQTGIHGIPAMSSGQGLTWNGSTWAGTDLATQAELNAVQATAVLDGDAAGGILTGTYPNPTMATTSATQLGLTDSVVRRGKCMIATAEARSSTTAGLMTTPDRVQNIVLPTDGLIVVAYQALWKESVSVQARANIYMNSTSVRVHGAGNVNPHTASIPSGTVDCYVPVASRALGLGSIPTLGVNSPSAETTGQIIGASQNASSADPGGPCFIFAAAGTYDVSVQFWVQSSGTVTVKERKLWVWTMGF